GLYPASHGLVAGVEDDGGGTDPSFLADTVPTLASEAARAGITTVGVSANPLVSRDTNLSRGFETFVESGWDPKRGDWTPASDIDRTFLAWLARNRGLRFFAWLHYMDVHEPYRPPAPYRPPPPGGIRPQVASGVIGPLALRVNHLGAPPLPAPEVGYLRALYEGDIAAWDAELGRLLGALGDLGVLDTTVVVVLSDHGEEFQDHGKLTHGVHLYDELVRVPFVVAGPGVAPGRTATQVQGIDLFPTLARRLGVPTPARLPGADALAALAPRPAFAETRYGRTPDGTRTTLLAVRTPERKLIEAPALGHVELYDLASDPGEHHDRAAAEPHADLAALLATWRAATPAAPAAEEAPGLLDKLRALGYVE
ncbi:MAG TPA: sulfatase-like hydrolase/transferase, partial [Candidatus Binatia bacterium]|nr:sulfatase-like hydrolase/transferase [Candidatus Binatia bacterium]